MRRFVDIRFFITLLFTTEFSFSNSWSISIFLMSSLLLCLVAFVIDQILKFTYWEVIWIFPNPTAGILNIQFEKNSLEEGFVQIIDLRGRIVQRRNLPSGQQNHELFLSYLPAGIYFIKITEKGMPVRTDKIIKQ